jgi:CheY-like chemotaxis protein
MIYPPQHPLLIVEDSDEDFFAFERVLRKLAFDLPIYRCVDGEEALNFLYHVGDYAIAAKAPRPRMILLDLNLPGTDGREVLEQIKQDETLKTIPVVVFTTSENPKDVEVCYQSGANGYVVKPIDIQKLTQTVQVVMDYWFNANTLPDRVGGRDETQSTEHSDH